MGRTQRCGRMMHLHLAEEEGSRPPALAAAELQLLQRHDRQSLFSPTSGPFNSSLYQSLHHSQARQMIRLQMMPSHY